MTSSYKNTDQKLRTRKYLRQTHTDLTLANTLIMAHREHTRKVSALWPALRASFRYRPKVA